MRRFNCRALWALLLMVYVGMAWAENSETGDSAAAIAAIAAGTYKLGSGDLVKVTVFNQQDLSGEYTVSGAGNIAFPLIGDIHAKDLTLKQLEEAIINKLRPDYLLNPRVSVQVMNFRPFYILGEVKSPQSYPFVDGMTYLNAVAIAGGFTTRAKEDHVIVTRIVNDKKQELRFNMEDKVQPGDIIHIEERYF